MTVYKILTRQQWAAAAAGGQFNGAALDLVDGYIHLSTASQLIETVRRHFQSQADLVIVCLDTERLGDGLRWEPSRGGALFPHFYGTLPTTAATSLIDLPLGPDGEHQFPPGPSHLT